MTCKIPLGPQRVLRAACTAVFVLSTTTAAADAIAEAGVERDSSSHAREMIAFGGIEAGDKIANFMPADAVLSRILCRVVGANGRLYLATVGDPRELVPEDGCANVTTIVLERKRKPAPEQWSSSDDPGAVYEYWSYSPPAETFVAPEALDLIWISERYHELHTAAFDSPTMQLVNRALWHSLKRGGVLLIDDFASQPRSDARAATTLHRVDQARVRREMLAAGFEYVGASSVLRRLDDPHTVNAHDMEHPDRFVLKFRKP